MISLQHLGALAVIILTLGLAFVAIRWPLGKHATFSQHVAPYRHAIIFYNLLFTIVLTLLLVFFVGWFVPAYQLSSWFIISVVAASVLQYIVTLIPETGGWKTKLHRALAGWSGFFLLPALLLVVVSPVSSPIVQIVASFSLLVMVSVIVTAVLTKAKPAPLLLFQISYFAAFFVAILVATYL